MDPEKNEDIEDGQEPNENPDEDKTSPNDDEEPEVDDIDDDDLASLDEDTSKKINTALAQKKHWREKAKKQEARVKELEAEREKNKQTPPEKPGKKETEPASKKPNRAETERRLNRLEIERQTGQFLSDDQMAYVERLADQKGVSVLEAAKEPFVQSWLNEESQKQKDAKATPSPSNRGGQGGRDWSYYEKHPDKIKQLSNSEFEEFNKYLEAKSE